MEQATPSQGTVPAETGTSPARLRVLRDGGRIRLSGPAAGPVPTATVDAGDWIRVEVDPTDVRAPVSVEILDAEAAEIDLRGLLGSAAADLLDDPQALEVPFIPGPFWEALAACAFQQWSLHWNCFPLDPGLMAVDRLAAAAAAGPFGIGAQREARPAARAALDRLAPLGQDGRLVPAAAAIVADAASAAGWQTEPQSLPAAEEDDLTDVGMIVDSRLGYLRLGAPVAHTPHMGDDGHVERLVDSPDWRLTGIGMASTAEDTITAVCTGTDSDEVLIRVPVQGAEGRPEAGDYDPADAPYYHGIITDAINGDVLAFIPLMPNAARTMFEGTGPLARPLVPTDVLDIRHPGSAQAVETDLTRRRIDQVRRCAARAFSVHRLVAAAQAGGAPDEALGSLAKTASLAWKQTAQAAAELSDRLEKIPGSNPAYALSWIREARTRERTALAESPRLFDRTAAKAIRVTAMPALRGQLPAPVTLAELDLAGALAAPQALPA
ncbi:hypothetical protein GCM10012320_34380 [Sinomonas cellulolyticus]|uniref:Uncharacterized protein n=1 Tax=Sinomonas cellulolyticus TaxID=2801916 RepID=A0ABS1K662_9MICC|nr:MULTISPECIES: hypothetical protein [Sinomonas]MBL0706963.1 hypothetical protein [Sinomonas cellulolyticus]GHG59984.1 hypothetical protein GCM10012320_34380 [Sinomonas sp. KCTC 49339]